MPKPLQEHRKSRILVVAEKPSAARDIAAALGARQQVEGAFESEQYVVSFALGHLVGLKEPQDYKKEWAQWNFFTLPMVPSLYEWKVLEGSEKQFRILKSYLRSPHFSKVVNACDAGREGELIFDSIYRLSGSELTIERLWTSAALTPAALLREFQRLKPAKQFTGLRLAARARSAADWLIGMNASRAVSLAAQSQGHSVTFPVGRVQTPTLAFLVHREKEIRNFVSRAFTVLTAEFQIPETGETYTGRYEYLDTQQKFDSGVDRPLETSALTHQVWSAQRALDVAGCLKPAVVARVEQHEEQELPPLCFDLTELQKEANKLWGLNADQTLTIAQALYEKHKCISYPRSEFRHLTEDVRAQLPGILNALEAGPFPRKFVSLAKQNMNSPLPRLFDNAKVGDHHALIPTSKVPVGLTESEFKVYGLIATRFLAAFAPPFRFTKSLVVTVCGAEKHTYYTRGKTILDLGWRELKQGFYDDPKQKSETLIPNVRTGQGVDARGCTTKQEETKPPSRYTDATLLHVMQNPGSKVEAGQDRETLRTAGLGTPATRAATLTRLEKTGYLTREKKQLVPTDKAFLLFECLEKMGQNTLCSPVLTARWERALRQIEESETNMQKLALEFNEQLQSYVGEIVLQCKTLKDLGRKDNARS